MNYPRIFERVYCHPLLIERTRFLSIHQVLWPRITGGQDSGLEALLMDGAQAGGATKTATGRRKQRASPEIDFETGRITDPRLYTMAKPGVAVVPIYGVLAKNLSAYEESCGGGTDINPISHALHQALEDPEVARIILDIDSPGGEVTGIPEIGALVRRVDAVKPVIAFTDAMVASAAYWIGSQAREIYATHSARLGSIGVYWAWLDQTLAMEKAGLRLDLFTAGRHKAMGAPFRGITDDERAMLQAEVDQLHVEFKTAVTGRRGDIDDDDMQGQMFTAPEARKRRLVTDLVEDWETFIDLV